MDFKKILQQIYTETKSFAAKGKVADYIPSLSCVDPLKYGITLQTVTKEAYGIGDHREPFSIQSISKVFSFAQAYGQLGVDIWQRLGREPSGTAFNSLIQLEHEKGFPRNPFINAGAIVIADILVSIYKSPKDELLRYVRTLAGNDTIDYNTEVADSEHKTGHRNFALAYFMKSFGNIRNEVEDVLDLYFHQCSIEMCTDTLASSFLCFANQGVNPHNGQTVLNASQTKRLNALMLTTGLYNESGDFAFRVGMPGKSGVGGGVVAVIPGHLSMACWSPALNEYGNSIASVEAMERFTTYTNLSVF